MRYLGLDLGTRTLGISISDETKTIASGLTTLRFEEGDYDAILDDLRKILEENKKDVENAKGRIPDAMIDRLSLDEKRIEAMADGMREVALLPDPIGKTHVREGVVVRILNRPKFTAYKHKNFSFKVLEGIIKDTASAPDMEEAQEVENDG